MINKKKTKTKKTINSTNSFRYINKNKYVEVSGR